MKILLICGSREWDDAVPILYQIDQRKPDLVMHGGCRGVDMLADRLAKSGGIHTMRVDALWDKYGKGAGPARNAVMAALLSALASDRGITVEAVAFHRNIAASKGTKNMYLCLQQQMIHCDVIDA